MNNQGRPPITSTPTNLRGKEAKARGVSKNIQIGQMGKGWSKS